MFERVGRVAMMALVISSLTQASATESFPIHLKGSNRSELDRAFDYVLMTDSELNPIMSVDGSPLYQGVARVNDEDVRTLMSLNRMFAEERVEGSEREKVYESPWVERAFQVDISSAVLAQLFSELAQDRARFRSFFSGMSDRKVAVVERVFMAQNFEITAEDFKDLQRSALNPKPKPIVIPLSMPPKLGLWHMSLDIQVDQIEFEMDRKSLEFDPETQQLKIRFVAKGAQINGPAWELGRPLNIPAHRLPKFAKWDLKSYVEYGAVDGVELELALKWEFDGVFWRISLPTNGFQLRFLDKKPKVRLILNRGREPLSQELIDEIVQTYFASNDPAPEHEIFVRDFKAKGWTTGLSKVFVETIDISKDAEDVIRLTLGNAIRSALGVRIFPEGLGFHAKFEKRGKAGLKSRLRDVVFTDEGLRLFFDSRVQMEALPQCLSDLGWRAPDLQPAAEIKKSLLEEVAEISSKQSAQSWGVLSTQAGQWRLSKPKAIESRSLGVELKPDALDLLTTTLWAAGELCFDSARWWPRPAYVPRMKFSMASPPTLEWLSDGDIRFQFDGELITGDRDLVGQLDRKDVRVTTFAQVLEGGRRVALGLPQIDLLRVDKAQAGFLNHITPIMLETLFSKQPSNESPNNIFSLQINEAMNQWLGPLFKLEDFSVSPEGLAIKLEAPKSLLKTRVSKSLRQPELLPLSTELVSREQLERVGHNMLDLEWQPARGSETRVFYQWRMKPESQRDWGEWGSWEDKRREQFVLRSPGRYLFEVRAMSSDYRLEQTPARLEFIYDPFKKASIDELKSEESPWHNPSKSEPVEKPTSVDPAPARNKGNSPGFFGCSLGASRSQDLSFWLVLSLLFLFFGITRQRIRDRVERS